VGQTGADPPQNRAHTMPPAPKKGARGAPAAKKGARGGRGAPAAKKRAKNRAPELTEEEWAGILNALDSLSSPVQNADGPGLPEFAQEPYIFKACSWCGCGACEKVRASFPLQELLQLKVSKRWYLYHKAWWEGVTPEVVDLARSSKVGIPPDLATHKPMDVPAPDL